MQGDRCPAVRAFHLLPLYLFRHFTSHIFNNGEILAKHYNLVSVRTRQEKGNLSACRIALCNPLKCTRVEGKDQGRGWAESRLPVSKMPPGRLSAIQGRNNY
jgi:hypothetical protein